MGRRKTKRGYPSRLSGADYALELWGLSPHRAEDQRPTISTQAHKETSTMDTKQLETDDVEIIIPTGGNDEDYEPIPSGAYIGKLTNFRVVDKPDWKIEQDRTRNPDREPDKLQWQWDFVVTEGEYAGAELTEYSSRSWHERANAHKHAAALLGKPRLDPVEGLSTKQLIGRACQIWVTESTSQKTGKTRSYVDKILPVPTRTARKQPAPALADLPPMADDDDPEF